MGSFCGEVEGLVVAVDDGIQVRWLKHRFDVGSVLKTLLEACSYSLLKLNPVLASR